MSIDEWLEEWQTKLSLESYESVTGLVAQALLDMASVLKQQPPSNLKDITENHSIGGIHPDNLTDRKHP